MEEVSETLFKRAIVKPYGKNQYEVYQDITATVNGKNVVVPKGFITDGASVPRLVWTIYPPVSPEYLTAAIIHDYLYGEMKNYQDRKEADKCLYYGMRYCGSSKLTASIFYYSVSVWNFVKHEIFRVKYPKA